MKGHSPLPPFQSGLNNLPIQTKPLSAAYCSKIRKQVMRLLVGCDERVQGQEETAPGRLLQRLPIQGWGRWGLGAARRPVSELLFFLPVGSLVLTPPSAAASPPLL